MLEDDNDFQSADIFLEPPLSGEITDEDSGEEDGGGTMDNLNGHQLSARAEVTIVTGGVRKRYLTDADESADEDVSRERVSERERERERESLFV